MDVRIQPKNDSDVLIFGGTGPAVAISYRPEQDKTPRVIGKWSGRTAKHVIRLAERIGLPNYEYAGLAHLLCRKVKVDEEIPSEYYQPVAEVLAFIYRIDRPARTYFYNEITPKSVEQLEVNIAYHLIPLVDREQSGPDGFLDAVSNVRTRFANEFGVTLPSVRIRDDLKLRPKEYTLLLKGRQIESGTVEPERVLAVKTDGGGHEIEGIPYVERLFHAPAIWIKPDQRELAEKSGYYLSEPAVVMSSHLFEFAARHAASLFSMDQTQLLLDKAKADDELMVGMAVNKFGLDQIHALFQDLLSERIPIVDTLTILDAFVRSDGTDSLGAVRRALAPSICSGLQGKNGILQVVSLSDKQENALLRNIQTVNGAGIIEFSSAPEKIAFEEELARLGEKYYSEIIFEVRSLELRRPFFNLVNAYVPEYFRKCFVLCRHEIPNNVPVQSHDGTIRRPVQSEPRAAASPARLWFEEDTGMVNSVVSDWTDLLSQAAVDEVALFDAISDFYEIHGKRLPADIVYCSHPAAPLIAAEVARDFQQSHTREGACGRDHPSSDQVKMENYNLLAQIGFSGAPARALYSTFGRESSQMYLTALGRHVTDALSRHPCVQSLHALNDAIFIDPMLAGGLRRICSQVHDSDLFLKSVNEALGKIMNTMHFNSNVPVTTADTPNLTSAQKFFCYWDLKRVMSNHIIFSVLAARHFQSTDPCDAALQAELERISKEAAFMKQFYASGGWTFLALEKTVFIVTRPKQIDVDQTGNRLHSESGPAAVLSDGLEIYRYRGVVVPPVVINDPQSLSAETILNEKNAEVRRLMIARKGLASFIREASPAVLDEDRDTAGNPRKLYRIYLQDDEPMVILHVIDPAKVRLGLAADVFLRVPPGRGDARRAAGGKWDDREESLWEDAGGEMKTCTHAAAWTFGFKPEEYVPVLET